MKTKIIMAIGVGLLSAQYADAQFLGHLKDKINQKVNEAVDKKIDKVTSGTGNAGTSSTNGNAAVSKSGGTNASLKTYSKYDFVAGDKIITYDDFSQNEIGDFPGKWNTNASGEVMTVERKEGKWLNVSKEGLYIPLTVKTLPDNFTLEYDVVFLPAANYNGPNTAGFGFQLAHVDFKKDNFIYHTAYAEFLVSPYRGYFQYESYKPDGEKVLNNETKIAGLDRQHVQSYHVAVWRQKGRVRVYLNENKVCDLPTVLPSTESYNAIRFKTEQNNDGSNWLITNVKLASGAPDMRNKLISEGKLSTTGILFDVNAATINAASYGTLKQISQVLQENPDLKVKIVGHTDSDGDNASNLSLSQKRAEAVKTTFSKEFGIDASRMQTEGKGSSQPVSPNTTSEGKASNRRVEFIKL
ncbi:MAG: OmpA family protein [Candidatus Pedobacter colombiensis]|uniref:OmpA family protein n=1 Tax=Candidatus Pedobacter colombiensis TaxID=3121371 RepID=A0AAJ6B8B0_9SPHI|nr:OmpA family protein [Pedobacter sp.]WEK20689.1 MAG: OmpA family protein [Pedobacter sp.]